MKDLVKQLLERRLIAKLSTLGRDGFPHLVAVWFLWNGDSLFMPTNARTQKTRNIERDPRAAVLIDEAKAGFEVRGVTITGEAKIVRPPESLALNRRIHRKYLTEDGLALETVDQYLKTDDVTIVLNPKRWFSWDQSVTSYGKALRDHGGYLELD